MNLACHLCRHYFKEEDEVMYIATSYWHELGSKVNFCVSKPHDVDQKSFVHVNCNQEQEDN